MEIKQSESTAARRRIKFTLVDDDALQTRKTGTFASHSGVVKVSKNGVTPASGAGTVTEVSSTDMPGVYYYEATQSECDTLGELIVHISATDCEPRELVAEIVAVDKWDAVRGGMSALPNANAEAAGGLITRGSGAGQVNQNANGQVDVRIVGVQSNAMTLDGLDAGFRRALRVARYGQALQAGSTSTALVLDASASAVTDYYKNMLIVLYSGALEYGWITAYNGTTKVATIVTALPGGAPAGATPYTIIGHAADGTGLDATATAAAVWGALRATYNGAGSFGEGVRLMDSAISAAKFVANAITSAAIATDAITSTGLATSAAEKVRDSVLNYALDTGRTVKGFLRRAYALKFGKVTGQKGSTVTAYKADGTTIEYQVAQNVTAGSRESAGAE